MSDYSIQLQEDLREFSFQVFDVLALAELAGRPRYRHQSGEKLEAVLEGFVRLSNHAPGNPDAFPEAMAQGSVGVVPEPLMVLGNALFLADGQGNGRALFQTRNDDLLGGPMVRVLQARRRWRDDLEQSRRQGELEAPKNAEVRGRLLAGKAFHESALALGLFGAKLSEDSQSCADARDRQAAERLFAFLAPVLSWWPEYGIRQSGMKPDLEPPDPVGDGRREELLARELLGKKVWEHQSHGLQLMLRALQKDLEAAVTADCQQWALSLSETLQRAVKVTQQLGQALQSEPADEVLANASRYLRLFSYMMAAWMWLRQANVAARQLVQTTPDNQGYYRGKLQAARYFFHWELPTVAQDLVLLQNRDTTCLEMRPDWF